MHSSCLTSDPTTSGCSTVSTRTTAGLSPESRTVRTWRSSRNCARGWATVSHSKGNAGKPHLSKPTVVYDKRCATFHDEYVSLATVDGRTEIEYVLPDDNRDTLHSRYRLSRGIFSGNIPPVVEDVFDTTKEFFAEQPY